MSRYDDPIDAPTVHTFNCNNCQEETEQHRYQVKGWVCKKCNQ